MCVGLIIVVGFVEGLRVCEWWGLGVDLGFVVVLVVGVCRYHWEVGAIFVTINVSEGLVCCFLLLWGV